MMTVENVCNEIISMINTSEMLQCKVESERQTLEDIEMNSLEFVGLIVELEKRYGIEFDDEELAVSSNISIIELARMVCKKNVA